MKLIIGISGASGVGLALRFINHLPSDIQTYVVLSKNAKKVYKKEQNLKLNTNTIFYNNKNISAPISSGSFKADAMIVLPTSINTLGKIASGIADNLITRAASVIIKEQKKLILTVREIPYSPIVLENMTKLSKIGVIMASPNLAYYSKQHSLEQMEDFLIGKWFDLLGIDNNLYQRYNK
jgi:4-hydroxy-3-polyprenylbenzoate decarboxylase